MTGVGACKDQANRFTGVWKADCADYWGVQIRPAGNLQYSVTFCGLAGCLPRGEWMANTAIEGDPLYQVVSDSKIGIKRDDSGYFTYTKCDSDPAWKVVRKDG